MAAPLELFCWKGDYGLPSVDVDCLTVLAYAKFAGAPLKVHKITNPWRSPTGTLPALKTREGGSISQPSKIIIHLRKQKYNADYNLSAKEGADMLAFVSLLEEKLLPALIYTLWIDSKNYVDVTRCWYAENISFPLNFLLPNRMHGQQLEKLRLVRGDPVLEPGEQLEKERLGSQKFFFGDSPSSLDAYVFAHLAPLLKIRLPNGKLQQHLNSLNNLQQYCSNILALYFPSDAREAPGHKIHAQPDSSDFGNEPHKRRNQILSALFAVGAMLGYAILTGILTIKRERPQLKNSSLDDEDDEDED
uniref:Metaxin n=1 Tax=Sinocyclocheilus anshuiensis TaxID=1608454 RepID=A0A671NV89_9TELE